MLYRFMRSAGGSSIIIWPERSIENQNLWILAMVLSYYTIS